MNLDGACAVVTGAGRGIGRATALALATEGARVFGVSRTEDDLESLRKQADALPGNVTPFVADVNDPEKIHLLYEGIRKWVERMDLLVNAAGIASFGPSDEYAVEDWRRTLDTNLTGAFIVAREAVRLMRAQGSGLIVNVSSIAGKRAFGQSAAYCASKWGLVGMSLSMAEELRGTGIKVTALCPGATATDLWTAMPDPPARARMLSAEDVAQVIVGLARQPDRVSTDEMVVMPPEGVL